MSSSRPRAARRLMSRASSRAPSTSTTLNRNGTGGSGGSTGSREGWGASVMVARSRSLAGCRSSFSRGTMCAPVPFVSVSSTQVFAMR